MPGHSPHAARRRVMHGAPKQVTEIWILGRIGVALVVDGRRCDARQKTGAPGVCGTGDQLTPFRRGSPSNRGSPDRVWPACFGRRKIAGLCHAERLKYVVLNVNIFGLTGELLDQRAEQNVVDVGVAEHLTGTRLQRHAQRTTNAFWFVAAIESPRIFEVDVYRFA